MSQPKPPAMPPPPPPRAGYVQPAPKSTLSSQATDDKARRAGMGIVNPGGAQGLLEPASTTKNLVLGGGSTGLNLGGGGSGAPPAVAPTGNTSTTPSPIKPIPISGGFKFKKPPSAFSGAVLNKIAGAIQSY